MPLLQGASYCRREAINARASNTRFRPPGNQQSASVLNTSVNGPLNYLIGRNLGSDDAIEIEDSLEIASGANGDRYLHLPQGLTGQRPSGSGGDAPAQYNLT